MIRNARGFTLFEMLIALAITAILLGVALPNMSAALEASRTSAAKAALLASLTSTVNSAALTGRHAVLCASSDNAHCSGQPDWSAGWIAFLDLNANRQRDPGDTLITSVPPLEGKVRLHSTRGRTRLVFQPNGGNAGSNVTFTLCDGRGPARAETLVISNGGRLRYGKPTAAAAQRACQS